LAEPPLRTTPAGIGHSIVKFSYLATVLICPERLEPVAHGGIDAKMGAENREMKQRPVIMAVRPVRPPSAIPAPDLIKSDHRRSSKQISNRDADGISAFGQLNKPTSISELPQLADPDPVIARVHTHLLVLSFISGYLTLSTVIPEF